MNNEIFKDYSSLDCSYLKDYILYSTKEVKKILLNKTEVRKKFLEEKNHYEFVWLIQGLKDEELLSFIDETFIDDILNSNRAVDKINAIMTLENKYKNIALNKESVASFICKNTSLKNYLYSISNPFLETIFNFILKENNYSSYQLLRNLNIQELYNILSKENNITELKKLCKNYMEYIPIKKLNEFLTENEYLNDFLKLDISIINRFVENGLKLPSNIYTNKEFLNKYLEIQNIEISRIYLENLSLNNIYAYEILDKLVCDKYDNEVRKINLNNEYGNIKISSDYANNKIQKRILDMLIDKNFQDLTDNVLINLQTIVNFNKKNKIIPEERILLYKDILNFSNLTLENQKMLYFRLNKKYRQYLYDDFRTCQDFSYDKLNNNFINLEKINKSSTNKADIYELKGEEFYIPIHTTSTRRKQINEITSAWTERNDTLSISIISDKLLTTYQNPKEYVAFGFNKINKQDIMHVYHSDSFTSHSYGTERVNEILNPKELIEATNGYNEILIDEKENLKPDYIICYDEILDEDIMLSKKMNIPIVIIYTKFYKEAFNNKSGIESPFNDVLKYKKL